MHVKRGLIKHLYNTDRGITFQKDKLARKEDHLLGALKQNGYPHYSSVLFRLYKHHSHQPDETPEEVKPHMMMIPHFAEISERIRIACRGSL